jgi:cellulose synthase/poly-beta-1,6-N-acetylglucosamine synthase-like glycosyltransferase
VGNPLTPEKLSVEQLAQDLTVIVPAYNEAASIADTVRSIQAQTVRVREILVVDDYSSDGTGEVAQACGATVLRPPANTGSKAGAQNFALQQVCTGFAMAIDADTTLAPDAIEKLLAAFQVPNVAAACGFVIPRHVRSLWERGRFVEYLLAFTFYKPIQDYYQKPLISSGCFSAYRTAMLREMGGWSNRTLAEDVDLTWRFYQQGYQVRFIPEAVCYPIEPHDFNFMRKQLRRWSHGFVQNVRLHWRGVLNVRYLRSAVAVAFWDATFASFAYLILLPVLALFFMAPIFLLGYVLDAPAIFVPVVFAAFQRKQLRKAAGSLPAFFVLRVVNGFFLLEALWSELVAGRPLLVYEKGH